MRTRRWWLWLALACAPTSGCTHKAAYLTLGKGGPGPLSRHDVRREAGCDGELHSYNYQMCCPVQVPVDRGIRSTAELQAFVRTHGARGRVRAIGARHSSNPQICVERPQDRVVQLGRMVDDPSYAAVTIATRRGADGQPVPVADVDASLTMAQLGDELSRQGHTLGFGGVFFRGVTVAGALATGAHGSRLSGPSVLSARLMGVTLVDADGERRDFTPENTAAAPDLWPALQTHLGLLGLITRVQLRVEPDFVAHVHEGGGPERRLEAATDPRILLDGCDWGHIVWFPRAHRYLTQCGRWSAQTPAANAPRWENGLLRPYTTPLLTNLLKRYMAKRSFGDRCWLEDAVVGHRRRNPGLMHPVVDRADRREHRWARQAAGPVHRMVSSDVSEYQDRIPQFDFEVAVPIRHAQAAIRRASEWIDEQRLCLPLIGVFLRFSDGAATGLVAHSERGGPARYEPVMFFEFVVYAPGGRKLEDETFHAYRELAHELVRRFDGRAHWGKNYEPLFVEQREHSVEYAERLRRFARVARCMDPRGVFSTAFARRVGLRGDAPAADADCAAIRGAGRTPP